MINKDRLIQTFLDLVAIDSPSGDEQQIAEAVTKQLEALGATVQCDAYGNVVGKIPGKGDYFLLNAHLDTVEPGRGIKPIREGDRFISDGSTILGADPKSGVAIILETVTSIVEDKKEHPPIEIVFTLGEENGLMGAINMDYSLVSAKHGLTFDGGGSCAEVHTAAPGYTKVDAVVTGKSAHAGSEPERGISAIRIASEIISKLPLGRIDEETTTNIGIISGGAARNAIPETVEIKGEIRSRDAKKLEDLTSVFQKTFDDVLLQHSGAQLQLTLEQQFAPYLFNEHHAFITHLKEAYAAMELTPIFAPSGGATDVNIFHTHGIEAVVVGTGMYNCHTTKEYLEIEEMYQGAQFCEKVLLSL